MSNEISVDYIKLLANIVSDLKFRIVELEDQQLDERLRALEEKQEYKFSLTKLQVAPVLETNEPKGDLDFTLVINHLKERYDDRFDGTLRGESWKAAIAILERANGEKK